MTPKPPLTPFLATILLVAGLWLNGCNDSSKPLPACGRGNDPCALGWAVLDTLPHDPEAFTQGLELRGGELFESTGEFGRSSLRRVDRSSGEVLQKQDLPDSVFGEGLTVLGDEIFVLTWLSETCFVFDRETFELERSFRYEGQGWGLTHDGSRLIMSNGTSWVTFRDPETFEAVGSVRVKIPLEDGGSLPISRLNELEWAGGYLYSNRYLTSRVYKIDPSTGIVEAVADLRDLTGAAAAKCTQDIDVLNGIAYDAAAGRFLLTGKNWCALYELEWLEP